MVVHSLTGENVVDVGFHWSADVGKWDKIAQLRGEPRSSMSLSDGI